MTKYGICNECSSGLQPSMWFEEHEYIKGVPTGRVRTALNSLICPHCLKEYIVDDTFDSPWRNK